MVELKRKVTLKRKEQLKNNPKSGKWWLWLSLLVVIIIAVFFVLKKDPPNKNVIITQLEQPVLSQQTQASQTTLPTSEAKLADAQEISPVKSKNEKGANSNQNVQHATNSDVQSVPYKKGEVYKVYQFPFGEGKYSQTNPELDKLVEVLKKNPELRISISAYTDDIGDAGYNMSLSESRAKAIHDYLVGKGIEAGRMKYQGKGISTKYETKAENRRAEFVIS